MTIEQLTEYCVAAKYQNLTRAAGILYISQSTLSRHISDLESELNVQLVRRDNRVFELTEAGKLFYQEISEMLEHFESIRLRTQKVGQGRVGKLHIGSFSPYIPYVFEKMRSFRSNHPEIDCQITLSPNAIVSEVLSGDVDVGLVFSFELPPNSELASMQIGRDDLCLIVASDHPLAANSTVSLSSLRDETLLSLSSVRYDFLTNMTERFMRHGNDANVRWVEEKNVENMILHTRFGDGISLLPRIMAQESAAGCVLLGISDYNSGFDICLCWKKDNSNPALKLFLPYF